MSVANKNNHIRVVDTQHDATPPTSTSNSRHAGEPKNAAADPTPKPPPTVDAADLIAIISEKARPHKEHFMAVGKNAVYSQSASLAQALEGARVGARQLTKGDDNINGGSALFFVTVARIARGDMHKAARAHETYEAHRKARKEGAGEPEDSGRRKREVSRGSSDHDAADLVPCEPGQMEKRINELNAQMDAYFRGDHSDA
ncbi:hypothetical protein Micbo1qcDRAFT_179772 [Microdochium bolleyi]|uniref:Uncharacterized protein n=1 Tax=Microdochium bolleyi TaxID=196109 RepID=A0A136IP74_9PEZI|nr:hypothetical protein Micbo1qcDRAFT_179772 [Microdochium bolleyi]